MNMDKNIVKIEHLKMKISTLWIVVMFNMVFADILTLYIPEFLQEIVTGATPVQITQELMFIMAIIIEIPIIMIFLSRILKPGTNKLANITASIITIFFVTAGGSLIPHYIFFATIEVICLLLIIRYSLNLSKKNGGEK